jgi:SAM-dependent methyltransferase
MTRSRTPRVVRDFYETNPFPYYDLEEFPTFDHLKRRASGYVRRLDLSIDSHATLLEVGCGTGQLCNYLAHIPTRRIIGIDFVKASLELAGRLRDQLDHRNLELMRADLFHLPFREECFDVVLCHGVLHHTEEPERGFHLLARLVKPGGGLAIGLYHRLGRRGHRRRAREMAVADGIARERPDYYRPAAEAEAENVKRLSSWYRDSFQHPYESGHLLVETARWFGRNGLTMTGSIPALEWGAGFWGERPFFGAVRRPSPRWRTLACIASDLRWWARPVENGYFLVFGRKE